MAVIIASTHFAYPRRDGQAELAAYKRWIKAGYVYNTIQFTGKQVPSLTQNT